MYGGLDGLGSLRGGRQEVLTGRSLVCRLDMSE